MRTNTRVEFGLYDVTARGDSAPSCATAQPWTNVAGDLKKEKRPAAPKYGTLEHRQFLMDGSFELWPDEPKGKFWGLWSRQQSGPDGRFKDPPVLEVTFSQPHSSAGITLHFYEPTAEWASKVMIQWYGAAGQLLNSAQCAPDGVDCYCAAKVTGYTKLRITFESTNRPGRYLKLSGLDYGVQMTFSGSDVVTAHVLEEVDSLSNEISINTLQLTLYNRQGKFSILNPAGVFDVLQHKQKFTVWEDVRQTTRAADVVSYNMGTFYLSEWSNTSDTLADFTATDAVGLLDAAPHNGGVYDTTAGEMVADILAGYEYKLDPVLEKEPIRGYLPIGTRRSALQQVAFALGAVVDCSRSEKIKIYSPPVRPSSLITYQRKMMGSKVALRPLITGVAVTSHQYKLNPAEEELYKDTLPAGMHQITFSEPVAHVTIAGGQLIESGNNYAVIKVLAKGKVVLSGRKYTDAQTVIQQCAADLPPNVQDNVLKVEGATLISPDRAEQAVRRILNYYANRYEQTFTMAAGSEQLADMLIVESFGGEKVRGSLEKMEFDLTGGFLAETRVVGQRIDATAAAYTGEIHAGERSLI